jgi:hypothetical protein
MGKPAVTDQRHLYAMSSIVDIIAKVENNRQENARKLA